jgi:hypothetical protein
MTKKLLLIIIFLMAAVSVFANMSSYSDTLVPAVTDWSGTLSFQKFDSSLGTLNSVQIDLSGAISSLITIANNAASETSGSVDINIELSVSGADFDVPVMNMAFPTYYFTVPAGQSLNSADSLSQSDSSSSIFTAPGILSEFTGTGTIVLDAATLTGTSVSYTGGNIDFNQITSCGLTGTVTYNYEKEILPEPATICLLGLGTLSLIRRKR